MFKCSSLSSKDIDDNCYSVFYLKHNPKIRYNFQISIQNSNNNSYGNLFGNLFNYCFDLKNFFMDNLICYENLNELGKILDSDINKIKIEIFVNMVSAHVILIIQNDFMFLLKNKNISINNRLRLIISNLMNFNQEIDYEDDK